MITAIGAEMRLLHPEVAAVQQELGTVAINYCGRRSTVFSRIGGIKVVEGTVLFRLSWGGSSEEIRVWPESK